MSAVMDRTRFTLRITIQVPPGTGREAPTDGEPGNLLETLALTRFFVGHTNVAEVLRASMKDEYWTKGPGAFGYKIIRLEDAGELDGIEGE